LTPSTRTTQCEEFPALDKKTWHPYWSVIGMELRFKIFPVNEWKKLGWSDQPLVVKCYQNICFRFPSF
jgi:hypothetical protein